MLQEGLLKNKLVHFDEHDFLCSALISLGHCSYYFFRGGHETAQNAAGPHGKFQQENVFLAVQYGNSQEDMVERHQSREAMISTAFFLIQQVRLVYRRRSPEEWDEMRLVSPHQDF